MLRLARITEKVAVSDASVMLLGESGTGVVVIAPAPIGAPVPSRR